MLAGMVRARRTLRAAVPLPTTKYAPLVVMLDAEALRFRDGVEHRLLGLVCSVQISARR
jgi:hypothetical protein